MIDNNTLRLMIDKLRRTITALPTTFAASAIVSGVLNIARIPTGTSGSTVCLGNDSRLSDSRTPTAHNHAASEVTSGTLDIARIPTGTSGSTICIGNDSRLSDSRSPTAHATSHKNGGSDEIAVAVSAANGIPKAGSDGRIASGWGFPRILEASYKSATATGSGDQKIYTLSIPGGTLSTTKGLRIQASLRRTTGSGTYQVKPKYGAVQLDNGGKLTGPNIFVDVNLWANGNTGVQRALCRFFSGTGTLSLSAPALGTANVNSTTAQDFTLEINLTTSTDVITLDWVSVEVLE